jgi:hypothetical protein
MQKLGKFGPCTEAKEQQTGRLRVECAGVSNAWYVSPPPHLSHNIMRGAAAWFIDDQQAGHDAWIISRHRVVGGAAQF